LRVIAEGVETEGQLKHLRELGCDEFQGFLFSPAVPSEELVRIFQSHHSRPGEITVGPASATHQ
ncbi:MAG: EAL domain-containing protein, partial [Nitrospirae bacterium]|nr:EAL domain-containing protein [Nitrospirota bacterium]